MNARDTRFRELMREHGAAVARVAASYSRQRAEREDLEQDIWFAVWRALPAFRGEASLKTFILRIAHNRAVDTLASRRPQVFSIDETNDPESEEPSPDVHVTRDEQARQLHVAVQRLPLGLRQAVTLRLEGLSLAEVAGVLGISENNATVRVARARARLRELLENAAASNPEENR